MTENYLRYVIPSKTRHLKPRPLRDYLYSHTLKHHTKYKYISVWFQIEKNRIKKKNFLCHTSKRSYSTSRNRIYLFMYHKFLLNKVPLPKFPDTFKNTQGGLSYMKCLIIVTWVIQDLFLPFYVCRLYVESLLFWQEKVKLLYFNFVVSFLLGQKSLCISEDSDPPP